MLEFFDMFQQLFEFVLHIQIMENLNMLQLCLIVITVFSLFRFFIFPLFGLSNIAFDDNVLYGLQNNYHSRIPTAGFTGNLGRRKRK